MKIVAAVLYCDRKPEYKGLALKPLLESKLISSVYINIESRPMEHKKWHPMTKWAHESGRDTNVDMWNIESTWRQVPAFDQDQTRLRSIVAARNMSIDYAIANNADYLLFVDSDVIIADDEDIQKLIDLNVGLCGGYVRGRGIHRDNFYLFEEVSRKGPIVYCAHGTCGYMLVRREVFEIQNFRYGWDKERQHFLSEDPAYCLDWYYKSGQYYVIHTDVRALHMDNPFEPLNEDGVAKDAWESLRA